MNRRNHEFKRMFEFGSMGPLRVKNRLVMAPMGTRLANEVGGVNQDGRGPVDGDIQNEVIRSGGTVKC